MNWPISQRPGQTAVAGELAGPGLDETALARCAERVTDRARRLALTV